MRLLALTLQQTLKLSARWARAAVTVPARVLLFLYEIAAISAVIQLGLALPMIVYFHRVGLSGLSANAFVVPVMGVAVPAGFVAVLTGWHFVASFAGWLLGVSQAIVAWHAALEPEWRIPTPPVWLGIAFSAALVAAAVARGRRWRAASAALVAALLALLLLAPFPAATHPGELEMTAIDVGQGDSLLVIFPDGKRMIVDGGGIPAFGANARSQLDIGEDVVAPYLWDRGIGRIDVMVLSHAHDDHIGGLAALVSDFHPKELWTGATPECAAWTHLRDAAGRHKMKIVAMQEPRHFTFGGAQIDVLAPLDDYVPAGDAKNNDSLVLRVTYGCRSFLLTGDVERPIERGMLERNEIPLTDVLKVPHHGSHTSSSEEFLTATEPLFAVISAGYENSYGHPHRDVLERLADHHAAVFRTDLDGLVMIRTDGKKLAVETGRDLAVEGKLSAVPAVW
jgi:competence protein ComEC